MSLPAALDLYLNLTESKDFTSETLESNMNDNMNSTSFNILFIIFDYVLLISVVVANIFVIYAFVRFKKLQTRLNYYVLFISINNLFTALLTIGLHTILFTNMHSDSFYIRFIEYVAQISVIFCLIFTFLLTVDWFLSNNIPKIINCYKRYWKIILSLVLICALINIFGGAIIYKNNKYLPFKINYYSFHVVLLTDVILVTALNILKHIFLKNNYSSYYLTVSSIIVYSYFVTKLFYFVDLMLSNHRFLTLIVFYLGLICFYIPMCNSIVIVYVLVKNDKNFKMVYDKLLRRSLDHYEADDFDQDSNNDQITNVNNEVESGNTYSNVL